MPMKQRRQAAAGVVQSLWTKKSATSKKKGKESKSNRPLVHVQPGDIGPISDPNSNDVLCGRGGRINSHEGNVQFREFCEEKKVEYLDPATKKLDKAHIAAKVVEKVRAQDPPGRFLKQDPSTGMWWDIGDAKAIKKVGQCMREDAPATREQLSGTASVCSSNSEREKKVNKEPEQSVSVTIPLYQRNQEGINVNHHPRPVFGYDVRCASSHGHHNHHHSNGHHPTGAMEGWHSSNTLSGNNTAYSNKAMEVVHEEGAHPHARNGEHTMDMCVERQQLEDGSGRIFPKPPSSNLSNGVSSLLAQSIISGISDGVSSLTFGDDYHNRRKQAMGYSQGANAICRKRPASDTGSGFSTASHSRRYGPSFGGFSPIQRANSIHSETSHMIVDQRDNGQQPRRAPHSHASDVSMGGFSVSMASLPSIGVGSIGSLSI